MIPEDITDLIQQIHSYRGPQGQRYYVEIHPVGPLDASSDRSRICLPSQTRRWIVFEEWYHSRGEMEGFLRAPMEALKRTLPTRKSPPGFRGQYPVKIYREDAAKEIVVKESILQHHDDCLNDADRDFLHNQIAVLREWGVLYGY